MHKKVRSEIYGIFKKFLMISSIISIANLSLYAQEYLEQTAGPPGNTSRAIAVHPDGSIFITSDDGSYYQSTNLGETWEKKSQRNYACEDMVITGEGEIFICETGVFKSTDLAKTWSDANTGLPSVTILSLLYDSDNGDLYAGTYEEGIYKSTDKGASWTAKNSGLTNFTSVRVLSMCRHTNGDIYAVATDYGANGFIYRSLDNGETWTVLSDPFTDKSFTDVTVTEDDRIFVTTCNGGVYRSDDGGISWSNFNSEINGICIKCITLLPADVILLGTTYGGLYRSADFGVTWMRITDGIYGSRVWDIVYDMEGNHSYVTIANGGIFRSDEVGLTWSDENEGLVHTDIRSLLVNENNTLFAGVYGVGVFRSYDQGQSWERVANGMENATVLSMAHKPGYLFAGTLSKGVFVSTTKGNDWTSVGLSDRIIDALAIGSGEEVFAGNSQGKIFKSTNNGTDWGEVYDSGVRISDIVLNKNSNILFAGMINNGGILRSDDGGNNWTPVNNNLGSLTVWALAASPTDQIIYASTDDGIYKTINNGDNWYKPVPTIVPVYNPSIAVNSLGEVFVGSNGSGLFRSRDGAENFILITEEPKYKSLQSLTFDSNGYLYVGTGVGESAGVFKSIRPTTERLVHFAVKMKNEDGFDPSTQSVVVRGNFNNWGGDGDFVLTTSADKDLTYVGSLTVTDTTNVIVPGLFEYKYVVPPDNWELFYYNRTAEWDGKDDLVLDTVWFSNQKDFTRMSTSAISEDGTNSRGVSWADYDNDGNEDLIILEAGNTSRNDLFRNNGDGTFTKITTGPVGTDTGDSRTACWGDYNNDGYIDLYITNLGGQNNFLYKNNGDGSFTSITGSETVIHGGSSVSAVWADFNNDGFLDLFVANIAGESNFLFMNNGDETFMTVTGQSIVTDISDSRGCAAADYDDDGDVDIFVTNAGDGENNFLYNNDKFGVFTQVSDGPVVNDHAVSSGGSWGDYNNDGWLDLYVTNRYGTPNMLYKNNQAGGFSLVGTAEIPEDSTDSRGSAWVDFDNDGLLDLYVANANNQKNILYKQRAGGNFLRVLLGSIVEDPNTDTRGAAWADFNNDGSPDLILGNNGGSNPLYRNNIFGNHYLKVKLIGTRSNSSALGAIVLAYHADTDGNPMVQRRDILGQTGFLSQNSITVTFGIGQETKIDSLIVYWPGGMKQPVSDISGVDQLITITEPNPTVPPPTPILNNPQDGATDVPIPALLTWSSEAAGTYTVQLAEDDIFNNLVYENVNVNNTRIFVDGTFLDYNITYYWRVNVTVADSTSDWSSPRLFTTFNNVIQATKTISFPQHDRRDEFSSSDYLLIGLPGNADVFFREVLGEGAGEKWMAYWDNGNTGTSQDYFIRYNSSNIFKFRTGQAFWIIHNGTINIDKAVHNAPLNELAQAEVVVHSGWNMITCPFGHPVSWDAVKQANGITADIPLYRYDRPNRRFTVHTILEPMEGFYFDNKQDTLTTLLVPYIDSFNKPLVNRDVIWDLKIELSSGETKAAFTRIGVGINAEIGLDKFDYRKPRALADLADIYFERPEWDSDYSRFGSDIRPRINEVEVWDFQVYAPQKSESELTFPGITNIPEEYEVYLIDKTRLTYQDLRDNDRYEFVSTPEISEFEIIIGDAEAVEEKLDAVIPMAYTLGQNYPNPFNPTTTIPLTLPEQSEVSLKVFNVLGQEVITLFKGTLNAGRHYFLWEGTNRAKILMPSGIYIYQMTTNTGFRFTGKMVLIK